MRRAYYKGMCLGNLELQRRYIKNTNLWRKFAIKSMDYMKKWITMQELLRKEMESI
jgi:hypothetical protein